MTLVFVVPLVVVAVCALRQFIVNRLATSDKRFPHLLLESIQIVLQQMTVELDFDMTTGAERTVIGLTDLFGQPNV